MALIHCPECNKQISDKAQACPECGYPVAAAVASGAQPTPSRPEELLAEFRPSWWNYFWHLFFFFLIVPLIVAIIQRKATVLRVYTNRITLERGIASKCYKDFMIRDIRSIDVDQTLGNRMVGIGTITISTAATVDAAETISGISDPQGVRELILAQRRG